MHAFHRFYRLKLKLEMCVQKKGTRIRNWVYNYAAI